MGKNINPQQKMLQVFNQNEPHIPHIHDEVLFITGRYFDIVNTKHKNPNTLYFGTSKSSDILSGLFLGDVELTSKIKDVSLASTDGVLSLTVKYVNQDGKLASVKASLGSYKDISNIKQSIDKLRQDINIRNKKVDNKLNIIDSSIVNILDHLSIIDTSLNLLNNTVVKNVDILKENPTIDNNFTSKYTLLVNGVKSTDSSVIEVKDDIQLKQLNYNNTNNTIEATLLPSMVKSTSENSVILEDNTVVNKKLDNSLIKKVSLDMSDYDEHIKNLIKDDIILNPDSSTNVVNIAIDSYFTEENTENNNALNYIKKEVNTNSSINNRVESVESQLLWENAF